MRLNGRGTRAATRPAVVRRSREANPDSLTLAWAKSGPWPRGGPALAGGPGGTALGGRNLISILGADAGNRTEACRAQAVAFGDGRMRGRLADRIADRPVLTALSTGVISGRIKELLLGLLLASRSNPQTAQGPEEPRDPPAAMYRRSVAAKCGYRWT